MPGRAKKSKRAAATPRASCSSRLTLSTETGADNGARWIQVAYEGRWEGYVRGEFELSKADLQQMVDNFHRHPSFKPGAELAAAEALSLGSYDVIPFDWRHLSTAPATMAPLELQAAQSWACDLKVVSGADRAELWALCRYLEPMGSLVRDGKVHWTSITADPHFIDPVTAEDRGWYVEAIAFTNDPFLQGMKVAADRAGGSAELYRGFDPYCPPSTPAEVLECLRGLFELPATSELGAVLAELAKLQAWATAGGAPAGVDLDALVGSLRQVFNLPTLASVAEVFAAADGLLAALAEAASSPKPDQASSLTAARRQKEQTIMHPALAKLLAKLGTAGVKLGRASTDEDAVEAIVEAYKAQLVVLEKGGDATAGLTAVLSALGVEDVPGATKKIAEMFKSVDQLEKAMPELKSLRESQEAAEDDSAEKDVGEAMKAHRMPAEAKPALLAFRTGGHQKSDLEKRKLARAAFVKAYPAIDARALALTESTGLAGGSGGSPKTLSRPEQIDGTVVAIDLSGFEGNNTERALKFLEKRGDFKVGTRTLSRPERFSLAASLLKQPNVIGVDR